MTTVDLWLGLALSSSFLIVFIAMEWLRRRFNLSPEITRRFAHIASGLFALADFLLVSKTMFLILMFSGILFIVVSHRAQIFTSIHNVKRPTFGEIYLPIGQLAAYLISGGVAQVFIPSLLVITFADAFAGLTSDALKKERKVLQGSLVFFVTAFGLLLALSHKPILQALLVAIAGTVVERFSFRGTDNLTVPIATSLLLLL